MRRLVPLMGILLAVTASLRPGAAAPPALVVAHRGGAALEPENTIAAFLNAGFIFRDHLPAGDEGWIEMDTQLTADGRLVIIHDDSLDRTTNCTGKVIATTLAQMSGCNAADLWPNHGFEPVPTIEDVLSWGLAFSPHWNLMIELKDIPTEANFDATGLAAADELVRVVHDWGYPSANLVVQSFWPPAIDEIERLDPSIRTLLLTTSTLPGAPDGVGFTLTENAVFATARGYEISSPDVETSDVTADGVARAHTLGRKVVVWTADDALTIARLRTAGVDGIMSNNPWLLL